MTPGNYPKTKDQMKKRYQVFNLYEACFPSGDFDTIKEAIEHCRHELFESPFTEEMIIKDTHNKDRIVRRFHWEDFNVGGKLYKPPACPKCQLRNSVPICYGYPSPATLRKAERGLVKLSGCEISFGDPSRHCRDCGHEWEHFLQRI